MARTSATAAIVLAAKVHAAALTDIQSWCKSVVENQHVGHTLAVRALTHAANCGDVSLVQAMIEGLRDRGDGKKHAYVTGLAAWVRKYSPIKIKPSGQWGLKRKDEEGYVPFNIEEATKNPFWCLVPEGTTTLDVAKVIKLITQTPLTRLRNAVDDGKWVGGDALAAKTEAALKAAAAAFERAMGTDGTVKVNADLAPATEKAAA